MSFSRPFDKATDSYISQGSPSDPCTTNFEKAPLCSFLLSHAQAAYFEKSHTIIGSRTHFTLSAIDANGNNMATHVGELPCPDQCLPGQPLLEFNKFELDHLRAVLCDSIVVEYLSLQKCTVNGVPSYAIYAHTGSMPLRDPGLGHKVYVSIQ